MFDNQTILTKVSVENVRDNIYHLISYLVTVI